MSDAVSAVADESDAHLIAQVRSGNTDAYGRLFDRHRQAAQRLAGSLVYGPDADDLVAEAFTRLLVLLQDGKGPDEAFRAYLLTAIRRLHVDRIRATTRTRPTDDDTTFDRGIDFVDPATTSFENQAAASAFSSLPERWQLVLWHLEVEGQKPADIAPLLGMSANSVSALAYRAREGLRQAYLQGHLAENVESGCRIITPLLGGYVRRGLSARDTSKVEDHLDTCRRCAGIYLELAEVNSNLGALLAPALLGSAASAYLSGTSAAAAAASGAAASGAAGAASSGAASGGAASGGATTAGSAASGAAATGGGVVSGATATGITAVGSAGTVGSAAVVGTLAQTAAIPLKAIAATVGTHSAVAAATAVVAGVATTTGVVVMQHESGPSTDTVATSPGSTGPEVLPSPAPSASAPSPEPSATATMVPEPTPEPVVTETPTSEPAPTTSSDESATPEPTETTPPPPPVPVTTDFSIGTPVISSDDTLGQRRVVVPFTVATTGDLPATTDVSVRVDFARTVVFRGIPGGGWSCTAQRGQAVRTLTCSSAVPSGTSFEFPFKAIGLLPKGTVTISSAADPDPSDDSASFAAGLWLLGS